jgi:hypothetical protein
MVLGDCGNEPGPIALRLLPDEKLTGPANGPQTDRNRFAANFMRFFRSMSVAGQGIAA